MSMDDNLKTTYLQILKNGVKPALGCTEPIAVALAVARASHELDLLGEKPAKIVVEVSANILKNAMGVGIPGTTSKGLLIASALGALCGDASLGLEVLQNVNDDYVLLAQQMVDEKRVEVKLAQSVCKLYVKAMCWSTNHASSASIMHAHDQVVEVICDQKIVLQNKEIAAVACADFEEGATELSIRQIDAFARNIPFEEIAFLFESVVLNNRIAQAGLHKAYGLQVGRTLLQQVHRNVMGDSIMTYAMALTAAAADARMAGCTLPAMSNSGSGNQGITVTLPVYAVAQRMHSDNESLVRALAISHLVAIHIKQHLGKLSALCGCVIASAGASCGIVYLLGGGYQQMTYAIKNMIGNITGMVCDGAKAGCALKVSSGTSSAVQSALLAIDNICISAEDGIIEEDIESSILNLARIGSIGMQPTDEIMLQIMLNKQTCNE